MATPEELRDEAIRVRRVRLLVDLTSSLIMQTRPTRQEAETLVAAARARALELFPGREETFDLLYARRFGRLIEEFAAPEEPGRAAVLPFRPRRSI